MEILPFLSLEESLGDITVSIISSISWWRYYHFYHFNHLLMEILPFLSLQESLDGDITVSITSRISWWRYYHFYHFKNLLMEILPFLPVFQQSHKWPPYDPVTYARSHSGRVLLLWLLLSSSLPFDVVWWKRPYDRLKPLKRIQSKRLTILFNSEAEQTETGREEWLKYTALNLSGDKFSLLTWHWYGDIWKWTFWKYRMLSCMW
jgi:hypothetical protein